MKIVHVLPALTKGGGERVMAELAGHATRSGHDVTVIAACPVDPSLLQDDLDDAIDVRFVRPSPKPKVLWYLTALIWIWKERYWLSKQEVIHAHMTYGSFFCTVFSLYLKLFKVDGPVLVETCHSAGAPLSFFRRKFNEAMMKRRDAFAIIAEDDHWKSFSAGNPDIPSRVILNGVVDPTKSPITEVESEKYRESLRPMIGREEFVVGTIGMLRADRQPWLFVPIFAQIAKECPNVRFIFVGGGEEYGHLKRLFEDSGIMDKVILTGTENDTRYPLSLMNLYISLNVGPVTGLAGMEACMAGVPLIGLQWIPDYAVREDDWIWSSVKQEEVASKAVELIKSDSQRRYLKERQFDHLVTNLSVDAMASAYYGLYQSAIDARK